MHNYLSLITLKNRFVNIQSKKVLSICDIPCIYISYRSSLYHFLLLSFEKFDINEFLQKYFLFAWLIDICAKKTEFSLFKIIIPASCISEKLAGTFYAFIYKFKVKQQLHLFVALISHSRSHKLNFQ